MSKLTIYRNAEVGHYRAVLEENGARKVVPFTLPPQPGASAPSADELAAIKAALQLAFPNSSAIAGLEVKDS